MYDNTGLNVMVSDLLPLVCVQWIATPGPCLPGALVLPVTEGSVQPGGWAAHLLQLWPASPPAGLQPSAGV